MKNNDNEVFSVEELNNLNEKLKENENISLPQGLSAQKIENKLKNQTQFIPLRTEKKKINKKRLQRFIAMAASIVIVFTSLMVAKPWQDKNKPVAPTNNNAKTEDYSEIENMFAAYADEYKKQYVKDSLYGVYEEISDSIGTKADSAVDEEGIVLNSAAAPTATGSSNSSDFGKTNEQVQGVSEADIIKNDGKYIYYVVNDYYQSAEIHIVSVDESGKFHKVSEIKTYSTKEDSMDYFISEIYVKGSKIIAIAKETTTTDDRYYSSNYTHATCYDISDIKNPVELWSTTQDGRYISSRLIGDTLILLSNHRIYLDAPKKDIIADCIPTYAVDKDKATRVSCDSLYIMEPIHDTSYLMASSLNIENIETLDTLAVLGGGNNVYCNTTSLYVASVDYPIYRAYREIFNVDDIKTQIFKFNIINDNLEFSEKTSVKGTTLNQFSMDEYKGNLRIATTSGAWGDTLENHLYILDKNLNIVGSINNIAKGETIKSVRFTGDTGYVVTFEQTDPLFVIDLSDPTKPEIKGELKIPGFSAYLHPVGEGLLIGIGYDGNESGTNGGIKISLFDASNPEKPEEVSKITVQPSETYRTWLDSEAFDTHKAICWDSDEKTMYIPYSSNTYHYTEDDPYQIVSVANIMAIKVDTQNKRLEKYNTYSHKNISEFLRVTYIDDTLIALCDQEKMVMSIDKNSGKKIDYAE